MKQQNAIDSFLAGRRVVIAEFVAHRYKEVQNKAKKVVGIVNLYEVQCADGKAPRFKCGALAASRPSNRLPRIAPVNSKKGRSWWWSST